MMVMQIRTTRGRFTEWWEQGVMANLLHLHPTKTWTIDTNPDNTSHDPLHGPDDALPKLDLVICTWYVSKVVSKHFFLLIFFNLPFLGFMPGTEKFISLLRSSAPIFPLSQLQDSSVHPHAPWVCFIPRENVMRRHGGDSHLLCSGSSPLSRRARCSALFYSTSILAFLSRSPPDMCFHAMCCADDTQFIFCLLPADALAYIWSQMAARHLNANIWLAICMSVHPWGCSYISKS